ncbi:malto-oligosyltrehalose trehalohydrolase [Pseudomonas fluorescens ABAC62]|nr:malto-oligosyltrehalose trehalohydrolase [Pseudomonas fluorescens ABAC62]
MPLRTLETWPHGAIMLDAQHTRFALWAPDAFYVSVELENGKSVAMLPQAEGWFEAEIECSAGTRYRYNIDGEMDVPDPASRAQASDVHGWSVVVDPLAYQWRHSQWAGRPWHEAVIYELHVGALGGYAGVEKHLPRLAELGVTAIELMPLAQFPGERNWGYDGLGRYAQNFFREDVHTPWGAGINFERREVRDFFLDNALMWLTEYRFDGLRLDAVHAIDDPEFLKQLARRVRQQVDIGRHVWLVLENEFNQSSLLEQDFDAQWNDDGHNALHVLLTGETDAYYSDFAEDTTAKLARCLGEGFIYQGHTTRHGETRGEPSAHLPPSAFVLFLQNHDQIGNRALGERLHQLCKPQALKAATALLLMSPMIPLMFMGDEVNAEQPFLFFTDHHGELAEAVREGRRNEFADFAAFHDPERRERIPDPNAKATFEQSIPVFADSEHTQLYRELLALRHRYLVPHLPGSVALGALVLADGAITARWRLGNGSLLQIDLNLSASTVDHAAPQHLIFATPAEQGAQLPPYSARVSLSPVGEHS